MSASASRRMASLVTSIMSQRPMLLSADLSYSARTYGSHAGSSPSASGFSFDPTDTMQMKKPSCGYTVQSARPRALYFTFQPGASSGIGAKTAEILRERGHEVVNIDLKDGDIEANLATKEGRAGAIAELHERYPEGIDAMICNAGVSGGKVPISLIISLNYCGATEMAKGVRDLLEKRGGSCVITSSNSIAQGAARMDVAGMLNNQADEDRILELVKDVDPAVGHVYYASTKYALARWVRRMSPDWGSRGVRLNAIAPGNVRTAMTANMLPEQRAAMEAIPVPTHFGEEPLMEPIEIANAMAFIASPEASGINGVVLFVDGGTDALLNSEKVY